MIRFTEAEAIAYFAEKGHELYCDPYGTYRLRFTDTTLTPPSWATLAGAIRSKWTGYGDPKRAEAEFERWLAKRRMGTQQEATHGNGNG